MFIAQNLSKSSLQVSNTAMQRVRVAQRRQSKPMKNRHAMDLQLLDFDCSEDAEGVVCWDALAQPDPVHNRALLSEVAQVLAWCHDLAPQGPGPLEDGAIWDFDLHVTRPNGVHRARPVAVRFDPATGTVHLPPGTDQQAMALSLSLSGTPGFAQAFREQFSLP